MKLKQTLSLLMTTALLAGCLNNLDKEITNKPEVGPDEVVVQTTKSQLGSENYRAVITDGKYALGASASIDSYLSSSGNAKAFEEGLLAISKSVFPTDQYFLKEGQLIDESTMTSWVSRESELYPEGLNPPAPTAPTPPAPENPEQAESQPEGENAESNEQVTSEANSQVILDRSAAPIYLAQIMEKDIMVETADGYALAGIVIGLAMNSEYQYTDENGVSYNQEISLGEMRERGKAYANTIVGRLRNTEQLRSVPIVVGIFRQAPSRDVVGGVYVMDGISREGNSVANWTEHNENRVSLPLVNSSESIDQYQFFYDFRNHVVNFFPNLNGITGQALYVEGRLASIDIEIVTQFYQKTEVTALTQHVLDMAQSYLPTGIPIEIKIESGAGIEAYVGRPAGATHYQSHVFH
ncbi:CamS family sex pheromone protein [Aerococcaceae bacterium NML191292]|nr:CamS family sex pheromone protein [Aerococcaceae bacterium NML191292]MCW6681037.1 CamS family sex pheromone protein [Aerococcaceae bacterium NML130460]